MTVGELREALASTDDRATVAFEDGITELVGITVWPQDVVLHVEHEADLEARVAELEAFLELIVDKDATARKLSDIRAKAEELL
jgi:hypothetical protein